MPLLRERTFGLEVHKVTLDGTSPTLGLVLSKASRIGQEVCILDARPGSDALGVPVTHLGGEFGAPGAKRGQVSRCRWASADG